MFHWDDRRCVPSHKTTSPHLSQHHSPPSAYLKTVSALYPHPTSSTATLQSVLTGHWRQMERSWLPVKTQQVLCCQKPLHTSSLSLSHTHTDTSATITSSPFRELWPASPWERRAASLQGLLCYQHATALK